MRHLSHCLRPLAFALFSLGVSLPSFAALSSAQTWEVRTAGSDSNGGGFKAGASGTDRSQQNAAQVAIDNSAITTSITTNVITFSAGYTSTSADVGNVVQMLTGTNVTAGFYEITGQTSTTWTVDRNVVTSGTTTNATGNMGGALATWGKLGAAMVAGNQAWIKAGAYTATSASTNVASGCLSLPAAADSAHVTRVTGYNATRGDGGTAPVLTASGISSAILVTANGPGAHIENLEVDGATLTSMNGFYVASGSYRVQLVGCKARRCVTGFESHQNSQTDNRNCNAVSCTTYGFLTNSISESYAYCSADDCGTGFHNSNNSNNYFSCIAKGGTYGYNISGAWGRYYNCIAYGCSSHGFQVSATPTGSYINCVAVSCGGYGWYTPSVVDGVSFANNAGYNNTSGNYTSANLPNATGFITLTGNPFTNAGSGDFSLNNTSGAGAALRAAAFPFSFLGLSTSNYRDVGAAQHQDSGGGTTPPNTVRQGGL